MYHIAGVKAVWGIASEGAEVEHTAVNALQVGGTSDVVLGAGSDGDHDEKGKARCGKSQCRYLIFHISI